MRYIFRALLLSLTLLLGLAIAQSEDTAAANPTSDSHPLAALAPADTVLALSYVVQSDVLETLADDLATLDWEGARATLHKLITVGQSLSDDPDMSEMLVMLENLMQGFSEPEAASQMIFDFCPAYGEVLENLKAYSESNGHYIGFEELVTVSVGPASPLPVFTALVRIDEAAAPLYDNMFQTLLTCAKESGELEITELEGGETPLYVLGNASDFPLVFGSVDNLYVASTSPDVARSVLRRLEGADEPSLTDTDFYQRTTAELQAQGFSLSLDFAAVADLLESYGGMLATEPEMNVPLARAVAALRTLGGFAGNLHASDEGLVFESVLVVNPAGGDPELAELLLCQSCNVSLPPLAPAGSVGASATYIPLNGVVDYLQGWLDDISEVVGEPLELKTMLLEEFGFDLDTALLDWIGTDFYSVVLEPISTDLHTLIYGQAQVMFVPVSDVAAAKAGLESLAETLVPLLEQVLTDPLRLYAGIDPSMLSTAFARSQYDYQGVTITRYRYGFNSDIGVAFIGNYLAVGTPAGALEPLIDTFEGAASIRNNPTVRAVLETTPDAVTSLSYHNDRALLLGLADIVDVVSQPLAFGISTGLTAALADTNEMGYLGSTPSLAGVSATPLEVPSSVEATLALEANTAGVAPGPLYYELTGLMPGGPVTVKLESDAFDTYLSLINKNDDMVIDVNDDFADEYGVSKLTFVPAADVTYWVEVGSYYVDEAGDFTLGLSPANISQSEQTATPLAMGEIVQGTKAADVTADYYEIAGLTPGETISLSLISPDFDTYLELYNAETGILLYSNDDFTDTNSQITWTPEPGVTYRAKVSGYYSDAAGEYSVRLEPAFETVSPTPPANSQDYTPIDLSGVSTTPLTLGETVQGTKLGPVESTAANITDYYELNGLTPGEQVTITLSSPDFDTYLSLIDAATETYLASNDDVGAANSELSFTVQEGTRYWLEVTSYYGDGMGDYTLSLTSLSPADIEPLELPSFAELLNLTELLPQTLRVLAEHASYSQSYSEIDGDSIHSYSLMHFVW